MAASITDIKKLIFSADGSPFAKISVGATVLGTSADGSPWIGSFGLNSNPTSHIKSINSVNRANIKSRNGVLINNIKSVNGVE